MVISQCNKSAYKIETHQERTNQGNEPLGTHVVKNAIEIYKNPKYHSVYFSNFFWGYSLICDLTTKRFRATGTMRNDRIMKWLLVDVNKMKKNKRRSFYFRNDGNIEVVRWNDILLLQLEVMCMVCSQYEVQKDGWIAPYNRGMCTVDLLDPALSDLRSVICGKK